MAELQNNKEPLALNNLGEVLARGPGEPGLYYVWRNGEVTQVYPLPGETLPAGERLEAVGMNDARTMAGKYLYLRQERWGWYPVVCKSGGELVNLGLPANLETLKGAEVYGLNNMGKVIGSISATVRVDENTVESYGGPVIWTGSWARPGYPIAKLPIGASFLGGTPLAINDSGTIVGEGSFLVSTEPLETQWRACAWISGQMVSLGISSGPSRATGVNGFEQIIGSFFTGSGEQHAFFWDKGAVQDLGSLGNYPSEPVAVNDRGQVVGRGTDANYNWRAFYWDKDKGQMVALGSLLAPGWESWASTLGDPVGINELGQILTVYRSAGSFYVRLLVPVYPLVVNSAGDEPDANPGDGAGDVDPNTEGQQCTLRAALQEANAFQGPDTIFFDLPEGEVIRPQSPLPQITDPVVLDTTLPPPGGRYPRRKVRVDGAGAGSSAHGLHITGGDSVVKGLIITGFRGHGVLLESIGGNALEGNYIGTVGTVKAGNGQDGVQIRTYSSSLVNNIISGNEGNGVAVDGPEARGVFLMENKIGTTAQGGPLGNGGNGVLVRQGQWVFLGEPAPATANLIAYNQGAGLAVLGNSSAVDCGANSIHSNGGLGIDLAGAAPDGVTPNDTGDADQGPNGLQNFPVLDAAQSKSGFGTLVRGRLDSKANGWFRTQFFANLQRDPSGNGEGERFLGFQSVQTDSSGGAAFVAHMPEAIPPGQYLTGTISEAQGSISEFSAATPVQELQDANGNGAPDLVEDLPLYLRSIADQFVDKNGSLSLPLPVGGPGGVAGVQVSATSSNPQLLPPEKLTVTKGTGLEWTLTATPTLDQTGQTIITVALSYGNVRLTTPFGLTVGPVPVLTLGGGKARKVYRPDHMDLVVYPWAEVLKVTLSVNDVASWWVNSIKFQGNGVNGHEVNDLQTVALFLGGGVLSQGVYSADDGVVTMAVNQLIPAGGSITLYLAYELKRSSLTNQPWAKEFAATAKVQWVSAEPRTPPYPYCVKLPPAPVVGEPLVVAPVWNEDTGEGFAKIQEAIDDGDTKDGHQILVYPSPYSENVRVTKELVIKSTLKGGGRITGKR